MTTATEKAGAIGGIARELLSGIDKRQVGAAVSKLVSASIGDICAVMSRSPAYKHYSLADIEWVVMTTVLSGQPSMFPRWPTNEKMPKVPKWALLETQPKAKRIEKADAPCVI